jgi:hypothetical protein
LSSHGSFLDAVWSGQSALADSLISNACEVAPFLRNEEWRVVRSIKASLVPSKAIELFPKSFSGTHGSRRGRSNFEQRGVSAPLDGLSETLLEGPDPAAAVVAPDRDAGVTQPFRLGGVAHWHGP